MAKDKLFLYFLLSSVRVFYTSVDESSVGYPIANIFILLSLVFTLLMVSFNKKFLILIESYFSLYGY